MTCNKFTDFLLAKSRKLDDKIIKAMRASNVLCPLRSDVRLLPPALRKAYRIRRPLRLFRRAQSMLNMRLTERLKSLPAKRRRAERKKRAGMLIGKVSIREIEDGSIDSTFNRFNEIYPNLKHLWK